MGTIEAARALGVSKALVSKLVGRGMPLGTVSAMDAWRAIHAPPRQWKSKASSPSPIKPSSSVSPLPIVPADAPTASTSNSTADESDGPQESLRRAKAAENASYKRLFEIQRDKNASMEDIRKASLVYIASRSNRQRAELDFRDHQRASSITMFYDEAVEICGRGHLAVAKLLGDAPKSLTPRLVGMPAKAIERAIASFCDKITEQLRQSF